MNDPTIPVMTKKQEPVKPSKKDQMICTLTYVTMAAWCVAVLWIVAALVAKVVSK